MSSILSFDLDFLNLCQSNEGSGFLKNKTPKEAFDNIMNRVNLKAKITMSIEHHEAYGIWNAFIDEGRFTKPKYIFNIDEHHDLYNNYNHIDCANCMLFTLRQWPKCKVTWIAANKTGNRSYFYWGFHNSIIKQRFQTTLKVPNDMGDVDLISLTISPDFIKPFILRDILPHIEKNYGHRIIGQFPTLRENKNSYKDETYPSSWTMRHVRRF